MKGLLAPVLCLTLLACTDSGDLDSDAEASAHDHDGSAPAEQTDGDELDAGSRNDAGAATDARSEGDARSSSDSGRDAGATADAAASDAALNDARAPTDAGGDATPGNDNPRGEPRCTGSGLKFCDDFEANAIDTSAWEKLGNAELDRTNDPGRGLSSLHVHTTNNGLSGLAHRASFPFANERFWGRMLVKIKNLPTAPDWAHWTLVGASPQGNLYSSPEHRIGGQYYQKNYWGVGSDHGATGDWTNLDMSSQVKLDSWQCIEWLIDSNQDVSQVFRDGVEIKPLATSLTTKHEGNASVPYDIPAIRQIWTGFVFYQGSSPAKEFDVWIDSFALHSERIGCAR